MLGNFTRIVLKGGESSTISFEKPILPNKKGFCFRVVLKKEPYYPNEEDESSLRADFHFADGSEPQTIYIDVEYDPEFRNQFVPHDIDLGWKEESSFSLTYSVKDGAGKHELKIKEILAFDGYCDPKSEAII
ncbi:uncharacterized protein TNCT_151531 [Trichonephila clavata]|uniref:Uncharacterized protein n=1 Tax=Trichonephila clavata TaxID=2740835 RepID=A0A8X6I9Q7_TRICU|nr:uncharacterized protein TNCT_151531 [Trichonephila clavata]